MDVDHAQESGTQDLITDENQLQKLVDQISGIEKTDKKEDKSRKNRRDSESSN